MFFRNIWRDGCLEDFRVNIKNVSQEMKWFCDDYKDVCKQLGIKYDDKISNEIMNNWNNEIDIVS